MKKTITTDIYQMPFSTQVLAGVKGNLIRCIAIDEEWQDAAIEWNWEIGRSDTQSARDFIDSLENAFQPWEFELYARETMIPMCARNTDFGIPTDNLILRTEGKQRMLFKIADLELDREPTRFGESRGWS